MRLGRRGAPGAYSLRRRLFAATVLLVALALGASFLGFERSARGVVLEAVHSHLAARAREAQQTTLRFQAERSFAVRSWAEAEAMQLSLDSLDAKFAEDYLRRAIQDQGGAFSVAALVDTRGAVVAAVRAAADGERRGLALERRRGVRLELAPVRAALGGEPLAVALAPVRPVDDEQPEGLQLVLAVPVKDFAGDVVGAVAAAVPPAALQRQLAGLDGGERRYVPLVTDVERLLLVSLPDEDVTALAGVAAARGDGSAALERGRDARGEPLLAVRTAPGVAPPGWTTVMTVHEREALDPLVRLRWVLAGVFALVLAGSAAVSVVALRRAARPLTEVAGSMVRMARGDLSARLPEIYTEELGHLVKTFNVMVGEVARSREELRRNEALRREMQIAQQIQCAIVPSSPSLRGYDIAVRMKPAEDVGGDLYDVVEFEDTFWLVIGDVSGHGLNSGLIMMMAQAAAHGAIVDDPHGYPRQVLGAVNRVIHENVRNRMGRDDYLTLMVARHMGEGRFVAAGAHQPVFIARATGEVDVVEPVGPWMGMVRDVAPAVVEYEFSLGPEEVLCLVTDGIVEASGAREELYGEERLKAVLRARGAPTAAAALDRVFTSVEEFAVSQSDDMTAVVLRRKAHAHA